jgi:hypothetical protein
LAVGQTALPYLKLFSNVLWTSICGEGRGERRKILRMRNISARLPRPLPEQYEDGMKKARPVWSSMKTACMQLVMSATAGMQSVKSGLQIWWKNVSRPRADC